MHRYEVDAVKRTDEAGSAHVVVETQVANGDVKAGDVVAMEMLHVVGVGAEANGGAGVVCKGALEMICDIIVFR